MPSAKPDSQSMMLPVGFQGVIMLMILVTAISVERVIDNNERFKLIATQHNAKTELIMVMCKAAGERLITLPRMVNMEDPFDREEQFDCFNELATRLPTAHIAVISKVFDEKEQTLFEQLTYGCPHVHKVENW